MCSISLTEVVNPRSLRVVKTSAISSGEIPENVHITLATGMSISGNTSAGIRTIASTPMMTITSAITTKVYGRFSANLTIHIDADSQPPRHEAHLTPTTRYLLLYS